MLSFELTRVLQNGSGGPMPPQERHEWVVSLADDMRDIPGDLALEAVREARKHSTRAAEILPFVTRYVEDYPHRRRRRLQRLLVLADIAGVEVE